MGNLLALTDVESGKQEWLDETTGQVFADSEGFKKLREMVPTDYLLGDRGEPVRGSNGKLVHISELSNAAAEHYHRKVAEQTGRPTPFQLRDQAGHKLPMIAMCDRAGVAHSRPVGMRDGEGRLVKMDLGINDVHTNAAISYAGGYRITDGMADAISPVIMQPKASDVYYTWNSDNDFKRKLGTGSSAATGIPEVNPTLGPATYTTQQYALGGFIPTEIQANADSPLQPSSKLMQMIVDGLRLEREYRLATLLQTSGSWNSALVQTLTAGLQWNGGAGADPVAILHHAIEQSYMPVTGIFWSELVQHDFVRNPAVQKFFTYKDRVDGLPDPAKLSSILGLPPIHVAMMKYFTSGALQYVWGNHVVLTHEPASMPPTNQMDVATTSTFRWLGGSAPDGSVTSGLLVRNYYDPKRGARGGNTTVCVHNDAELMTSGLVGGLILNAHQ